MTAYFEAIAACAGAVAAYFDVVAAWVGVVAAWVCCEGVPTDVGRYAVDICARLHMSEVRRQQ
nr:hypothetical protein [Actinomyces sp.]